MTQPPEPSRPTPNPRTALPWTIEAERRLVTSRVFDINERTMRSRQDPSRVGDFVVIDSRDWANVIAITDDHHVVMIEQFRHGLNAITLELPGGIVDHAEDPAETCRRELLEETGYTPPSGTPIEIISRVSANPAILTNHVHTGLVRGVTKAHAQSLDEHEEIAIHLVPLARIPELINSGRIHHSLIVAGLGAMAFRLGASINV
ncbi:MAG: NUDIX hydrolase [Phycisphaerales bacterium]